MTRDPSDILADIERLVAELRSTIASRERAAPDCTAQALAPAQDDGFDLSLKEAAGIAKVTEVTVRSWAVVHGIGRKRVGRWAISERRLRALLDFDAGHKVPMQAS